MKHRYLSEQDMTAYCRYLRREDRSKPTIEKYRRCVARFVRWLDGRRVTKELVLEWKELQIARGYAASTINTGISALNGLFRFLGWRDYHIRFLRIQRKIFRDPNRELTRDEYRRLCAAAREGGNETAALLMETIACTGIRVSEVQYITIENISRGRADILMKGKVRTILLPRKLCNRLLRYAKKKHISHGVVFCRSCGSALGRHWIWATMKALCPQAEVKPSHVFPHNLRHLFATTYYQAYHDIVKLADILGHSSLETTRIYLLTTGAEHQQQLNHLHLLN